MSNDRPIVVAPRPVRLASALLARRPDAEFSFVVDIRPDSPENPDRHSRPPSATEALDEFLSILRPTFIRKPFAQNLSLPFRQLMRVTSPDSAPQAADHKLTPSPTDHATDTQLESDARHWLTSTLLSSPVSRFHTRNPFQRNREGSPVSGSPLSPASIPLPAPSPGELLETI